jgi:hypothetical protein
MKRQRIPESLTGHAILWIVSLMMLGWVTSANDVLHTAKPPHAEIISVKMPGMGLVMVSSYDLSDLRYR